MEYTGKLYGKVGRKYVPLAMTSDDVDNLYAECEATKHALREALSAFTPNGFTIIHGSIDRERYNRLKLILGVMTEKEQT